MIDDSANALQNQVKALLDENKTLKGRLDLALNFIALLQEEIQNLKDEIARLKGQKPKPKIPPSILEGPHSKDKQENKLSRGMSPRQHKTNQLKIHEVKKLRPEIIPSVAIFKGSQKYVVQDVRFSPHNIRYELERWMLPDGSYLPVKLPDNIQGHYGPTLITYMLNQYYGCRVTAPLLLEHLHDMGIFISSGQLSAILMQRRKEFHEEKNELLNAGIKALKQIQVDDTGGRHKGQNCYSTMISNKLFAYVETTESKSRENFLRLLHGKNPKYLINDDTREYIAKTNPSSILAGYLVLRGKNLDMDTTNWEKFLLSINITTDKDVKLVSEAALYAGLINHGVPKDLGVHGDDAGQFNAFVRSLCWVHEERHYSKIIALDDVTRLAIERIRTEIWEFYRLLKAYKIKPTLEAKTAIFQKFDTLFSQETASFTLNKQLAKTYAKKEELLRVLDRPETPLNNNMTETDIREVVIKRKISGGTRSVEGKRCRDTFISLKKTCRKLKISFWDYLSDRINGLNQISRLEKIILSHAEGP
jgi:hypothetical protein